MGMQTFLILAAVALSAWVLLRDLLPAVRPRAGRACGGCHGGCPAQLKD